MRKDDQEDVIRERLRVYESQTRPVIDYYRSKGRLYEVDGLREMEAVARDVAALIEQAAGVAQKGAQR